MGELRAIDSPIPSLILVGAALYGLISPNPIETCWTGIALWLTLRLFWWQRTPGVLLYALIIPFIEAHGVILEANNYGLQLNEVYPETGQTTFWASSIGYVAMTLGFWIGGRKTFATIPQGESLIQAAGRFSFTKILLAVLAVQVIVQVTQFIIPFGSSLRQIEAYIRGVSSATILFLTLHYMVKRERKWLFIAFFTYFLITSFYSYFSSWRTPIALLVMASLVSTTEFKVKQIIRQAPLILSGFLLVFIWQTVKGEYREFLSQGERTQAIRVSQSEALGKFTDLAAGALQNDTLLTDKVVGATYKRIGYTEYFASAVRQVPSEMPFERGKLLTESINFALIPRIINPNKGVKNDRAKVEKYTDFYFGENSFSSFSLGHYCEAYIDWGPFWMHLHLFIYGVFGSILVRLTLLRTRKLNDLLKWGILFAVLSGWGTFQQDMITVLGRTVWGTFCQLVLFLPIYSAINRYCTK